MSAVSDAFVTSLRRISAERGDERAHLGAVREQVSVLLELNAEKDRTIASQRCAIKHLKSELSAALPRSTESSSRQQNREAA